MKYLAPKLKHRVQVKQIDDEEIIGQTGYDRRYNTITTLWAFIEVLNPGGTNFGTAPVRYQNTGTEDTHKITVRTAGLLSIGKAFTSGFTTGFKTIPFEDELKSDFFLFHQTASSSIGRLFRINRFMKDEHYKEFIVLRCSEIEEQGTGAFNA